MKLLPSVFVIGQSAMWSGVWRVRNFIVENSITFHRYDVFHVGLLLHSLIFTDDQNYTKILESDRLAAAICARELRNSIFKRREVLLLLGAIHIYIDLLFLLARY